jgi:hypothetical protein
MCDFSTMFWTLAAGPPIYTCCRQGTICALMCHLGVCANGRNKALQGGPCRQALSTRLRMHAGIEDSIFMKPAHLHLTLAMLKLYSEERRERARQVGWDVCAKKYNYICPGPSPVLSLEKPQGTTSHSQAFTGIHRHLGICGKGGDWGRWEWGLGPRCCVVWLWAGGSLPLG